MIALKSKNRAELARGHRAAAGIYARERNAYALALRIVATEAGIDPLALFVGMYDGTPKTIARAVPFRVVRIVRLMGERQRPFDDDGFIAGCAALRDAMQRERHHGNRYVRGAGIVWDDSAKWSRWEYAQEKAIDGRPGVRVEVSEGAT